MATEDMISQPPLDPALHPVVDPLKPVTIDPVSRPPLRAPLPQPGVDEAPPAKEGHNYWNHLPYHVEDNAARLSDLNDIIADLYTYIRAGDFDGGARTASQQIRRWLHLKFKMPKEIRMTMMKLYYQLALTPGIDPTAADTFANMFRLLTLSAISSFPIANCRPRKVPTNELTLDWRPLYQDLYRCFIRPNVDPPVNDSLGKGKDLNSLTQLARHAQKYFAASEIPAILDKVLPEV